MTARPRAPIQSTDSTISSMPIADRELKGAALVGLRHERHRMNELTARLERELGGGGAARPSTRRKLRLSADGRQRIIAATQRRWAAVRAGKAEAARPKGRAARKDTPKEVH